MVPTRTYERKCNEVDDFYPELLKAQDLLPTATIFTPTLVVQEPNYFQHTGSREYSLMTR